MSFSQRMYHQRGMTLIVGLIMVLLMTLVGMAAIRGSGMQEIMAGNMRDRNLAFQAAEAALREGEDDVAGDTLPAFTGGGYYEALDESDNTSYWDSTFEWTDTSAVQPSLGLKWVSEQPQYVVEEVTSTVVKSSEGGAIDFLETLKSEETKFYRVTSRGTGGTEDSVVILQSTYKR
ncbi:PilX N-terminal domain-containing pilus assembly protein [Microbulbifer sp.]|uniref:pilus assembly PilX family protein n=1 Tax=Microbulbifer sp. TaxID=1908541 RepID=UPI00258B66D0|nr:PilX N-terminal domain-containing pilus assembly protein [Microbulbifer sp.]